MRPFRWLALCAIPLLSCAAYASSRVTQSREVTGFDKVRIEGAVDAQIREGDYSVQISANEAEQPRVITQVEGDTLVIQTRDDHGWQSSRGEVRATISLPHFRGLVMNGAGDVQIDGVHSPAVALDIHGAGNIRFAGEARSVEVEVTGAGSVSFAKGHTDSLAVVLAGAGDVRARELVTRNANVDLRGTGAVELTADGGVLSLGMHGIGAIHWYGTASAISSVTDGLGVIEHG